VPDGLDKLAKAVNAARSANETAKEDLEKAEGAREEAAKARADLPETAAVRTLLEDHDALAALTADHSKAKDDLAAATTTATEAGEALAAALERVQQARAARDEATRHDHAAAAAEGLAAGDPCPICGRELEGDPTVSSVDLRAALEALEATEREAAERDQANRRAESQLAAARATLDALDKQQQNLADRITSRTEALGAPADRAGVATALERAVAADTTVASAEQALSTARTNEKEAARGVEDATAAMREMDERLRRTSASLHALELEPPTIDHENLAEGWRQLVDWAQGRLPKEQEAAREADQQENDITGRGQELKSEFIARAAEAGVTIDPGSRTFDDVPTARAQQQAHLDRLRADLERAAQLRTQFREHRDRQALAELLADTLRANKLEQWLLGRVLKQLVTVASKTFHDLSGGAYSLRLDEGTTVEVVDHANADLARSVQSLSGGETFLASLALALALADQVASLATDGAARLDALFIDEGFGTLDAETLDTVAAALQTLGETGRMIGVVTHVRNLAEQLPLRFEINKIGPASHVRRSDDTEEAA
jgi:exonuclease SbcC